MSWALSCLCLKERFGEVELYTDDVGKKWLSDVLMLPYDNVHNVYDQSLCLPHHWAYAKIKTYSLQKEPFLHVDGDVFVPHPFAKDIEDAALVGQNLEYGTAHYEQMLNDFLGHPGIVVPEWLRKCWQNRPLMSLNMGVFGGNDLSFIQRYCEEVDCLLDANGINDPSDQRSVVNVNVIFEQMLLEALASKEKQEISTVLDKQYPDTGYTQSLFCDFETWKQSRLLHIVGGNKRQLAICLALERKLFQTYPEYYRRIAQLFPERHPYIGMPVEKELVCPMSIEGIGEVWKFVDGSATKHVQFCRNPLARMLPYAESSGKRMIYVPLIYSTVGDRVSISPLGWNIFQLLEDKSLSIQEIREALSPYFSDAIKPSAGEHISSEVKYLLHTGVLKIIY